MDNDKLERDFKGIWIPKEVWLDERLDALEKIILSEVDSLDNGNGCFASNQYLAKFCQCSEWKVSNAVSKLIEYGYLQLSDFDGRRRILQSCLVRNTKQPCEIHKADFGISQHSNIVSNIENNIGNSNKDICKNNDSYLFTAKDTGKKSTLELVVTKYHEICPELSKVQKITPKREKLILKALKVLKEQGIENLFRKVAESDFLSGRTSSSWKADLEWILTEDNIVKIMEGKYDNRSSKGSVKQNGWERNVSCRRATESDIENAHKEALEREKNGKRGTF